MSEDNIGEDADALLGLIRKRVKVAGRIEGLKAQTYQRMIELQSIDGVIRLFWPNFDKETLLQRPRTTRIRGELSQFVLSAMRKCSRISSMELAARFMSDRQLDQHDLELTRQIIGKVRACLRRLEKRELIRSDWSGGPFPTKMWEIAP